MIFPNGVEPGFADHELWIAELRINLQPVDKDYSGGDPYGSRPLTAFATGVPARDWAKPKVPPEGKCAALIDGEFSSGCGGVP